MSLTGLIDEGKGTPLWDWLNLYFSQTRDLVKQANAALRGGAGDTQPLVPRIEGSNPQLVGTAIGYMINSSIRNGELRNTVALQGATALYFSSTRKKSDPDALEIEHAVVKRITEMIPWQNHLDDLEWREFSGLCCLLARFEQVARAPLHGIPDQEPKIREHGHNLTELVGAMVNEATRDDLGALGRAALEDHAQLRTAKNLNLHPLFTQSGALTGADADVVYDGTLLDFKSSASTSLIGKKEAWQLLGYLLADTEDEHNIERVGFSALRWRHTITWTVPEYLEMLYGCPTTGVQEWRKEFAELLETHKGCLTKRQIERNRLR
jgi:hypothetical protein